MNQVSRWTVEPGEHEITSKISKTWMFTDSPGSPHLSNEKKSHGCLGDFVGDEILSVMYGDYLRKTLQGSLWINQDSMESRSFLYFFRGSLGNPSFFRWTIPSSFGWTIPWPLPLPQPLHKPSTKSGLWARFGSNLLMSRLGLGMFGAKVFFPPTKYTTENERKIRKTIGNGIQNRLYRIGVVESFSSTPWNFQFGLHLQTF